MTDSSMVGPKNDNVTEKVLIPVSLNNEKISQLDRRSKPNIRVLVTSPITKLCSETKGENLIQKENI